MPHALLYIRDALQLQVESALGVPPPLTETPPDRAALLDASARTAAGGEWATWWATLLKFEARRHFLGREDFRERILEYHEAVDPETAPALAGTGLQAAARALAGEARDWAGRLPADVESPQDLTSGAFAWVIVRDTAEAVATAHGVEVGQLDGAVTVLLVEGDWWELVAPRFAFCSLTAARQPDLSGAILHRVFESGLAAA